MLNCLRVLARILPFLWERLGSPQPCPWLELLLWEKATLPVNGQSEGEQFVIDSDEEDQEDQSRAAAPSENQVALPSLIERLYVARLNNADRC